MAVTKKGITSRQQKFVDEYLVDLNATRAAERAGYKYPDIGRQLITKNNVSRAIEAAQAARSARTEITQDRVLTELSYGGFFDPADFVTVEQPEDIKNLPEHVRRAIVGWSWDRQGNFILKLANKDRALELIGKHLGMFLDKSPIRTADEAIEFQVIE